MELIYRNIKRTRLYIVLTPYKLFRKISIKIRVQFRLATYLGFLAGLRQLYIN